MEVVQGFSRGLQLDTLCPSLKIISESSIYDRMCVKNKAGVPHFSDEAGTAQPVSKGEQLSTWDSTTSVLNGVPR